jgi:conjugative transfer signal peptidase TraF
MVAIMRTIEVGPSADAFTHYAIIALASTALLALILPGTLATSPLLLVWNASSSAPEGLYLLREGRLLARGDTVAVHLPRKAAELAGRRDYLPSGLPALKHVAAMSGDLVCARGASIEIGGRPRARRLGHDGKGRPLPFWRGCRRLGDGEIFLLNDQPWSFDSRYFGPASGADVIGRAILLWPR